MNTRRYPRSLAEAFPKQHACAIERPMRSVHPEFPTVCVIAVVVVVLLLTGWLG